MYRTYDKAEFDADIDFIISKFKGYGVNLSRDEATVYFWLRVPFLERKCFHGKRSGVLAGCRCPRCYRASIAGVCNV